MTPGPRGTCVLLALALLAAAARVSARDVGQWQDGPVKEWYQSLKQPAPNETASCCGEADAYWADEVHVRDGKVFAVITDDRSIAGRTPVAMGTEIEIPAGRLKYDAGNPTGHSIVFLSSGGFVYCYVQGAGG